MVIKRNFSRSQNNAEQISATSKCEGLTIIGIDPGTNFLGYGIIHIKEGKPKLVSYGTLKLDRFSDRYERLKAIFVQLGVIIEEYRPDEMALEAPFFGANVQSMLKLGRAQGVAMAAALSRNIDVREYAPTEVKQAITGSGRASKEQVAAMVCRLLGMEGNIEKLDATDALGVALCHYFAAESPLPAKRGSKSSSFESIYNSQQ